MKLKVPLFLSSIVMMSAITLLADTSLNSPKEDAYHSTKGDFTNIDLSILPEEWQKKIEPEIDKILTLKNAYKKQKEIIEAQDRRIQKLVEELRKKELLVETLDTIIDKQTLHISLSKNLEQSYNRRLKLTRFERYLWGLAGGLIGYGVGYGMAQTN